MNQRSFQFRGLALLLALLLSEPGWTATPTVAPQLPDPGSVGITKEQQVQLGRQAMASGCAFGGPPAGAVYTDLGGRARILIIFITFILRLRGRQGKQSK